MAEDTPTCDYVDEEIRRRFEAHWRDGKPRPIEEFLVGLGQSRYLPTLEELIHIELEFAWKKGASGPRVEAYLARFPALNQKDVVLRLARQEFRVRHDAGAAPAAGEYRARFPEAIGDERELLTTVQRVETVGLPRPGAGSGWAPGDRVGRYQLAVEHGRGGVGLVWRASDPNLGREVALKQLNSRSVSHAEARSRFVAEARIAAQLEHPGVVPVYDLAGLDENMPYYTMKMVRGRTLTEEIRRFHEEGAGAAHHEVARLRLLNAFLAVARAMAYAHSRGVIHRDLKPDNIILGDYGETVILDWGLAKLRGPESGGRSQQAGVKRQESGARGKESGDGLGQAPASVAAPVVAAPVVADVEATEPGAIMGTPAYMSPEQAAGNAASADERSDVYALGAILYQLLTGRRPFPGTTFNEVLDQVLHAQPAAPRSLDRTIPRPLEAMCLRALAKRPEDRYPAAAQLASDLERFLADEPTTAYRESVVERLRRWGRRHKVLVAAGGVAALLAAATGVGILYWLDRLEQGRQREAAERLVRIRAVREADAKLARAQVQAGRFESAAEILGQGVDRLSTQPALAELRAQLEAQRSRAVRVGDFYRLLEQAWVHSFNEADRQAIATCEQGLKVLGALDQAQWWTHLPADELTAAQQERLKQDAYQMFHLLAGLHVKMGLMKFGTRAASESYRAALAVVARIQPVQPSQSLRLIEVFCHTLLGQRDKIPPAPPAGTVHATDEFFLGVIHFWIHALPDNFLTRAFFKTMAKDAGALAPENRLGRAEELLRSAIARDPTQHVYYIWLGIVLLASRDFHGAELTFGSAVALRPADRWTHNFRASAVWLWVRNTEDAGERRELCMRGLRYVERCLELDPNEPTTHWMKADLLAYLGRREEALPSVVRYLELQLPPAALKDWRETQGFFGLIEGDGGQKQIIGFGLEYAAETLKANPKQADARTAVALANLLLDKLDAAATAAEPLPEPPALPRLRAVRGTVLLRRKQLGPALTDFEAALRAAPTNYLAAVGKAAVQEQQQQFESSLAAFDAVLQVAATDWQRFEGHAGRARVLTALGRREEARQAIEQARTFNAALADQLAKKLMPS